MRDNRITAFAVDGTSYPLPMSMNDLKQALDPARFFRLNRQYIANIEGIRKISLYFGSKLMVKLKGCEDDNIVISKEKATLFKNGWRYNEKTCIHDVYLRTVNTRFFINLV